MADKALLIATGVIQLDSRNTPILVQADGFSILEHRNDTPVKFFDWTANNTPDSIGEGQMVLANFLVARRGDSFPAKLEYNAKELTLTIELKKDFSQLPNAQFEQMKVVLKQKKGGPLTFQEGSADMMLMSTPVPLIAMMDQRGLVFNLSSAAVELDIPNIGKAKLDKVEVQTNQRRWEDLQLLYNFGEPEGDVAYDNAGINPQLSLTLIDTDRVEGGGLSFGRSSKASTRKFITPLLNAVKAKNEFAIELWVKPETISGNRGKRGTILAMGNTKEILFNLVQEANGVLTISGSFTSDPLQGPVLTQNESNHIVFTHDPVNKGQLYINGNLQEATMPGDANWIFAEDDSDPEPVLALGDTPKGKDEWEGEIYNLAIYSRVLSEAEVQNTFRPVVNLSGTFKIANAPAPLDPPFKADFDLTKDHRTVDMTVQKKLVVRPELSFTNLQLHWEETTPEAWKLNGGVDAAFWKNEVALVPKLIGTKENPRIEFTPKKLPVSVGLNDWGSLKFTQLSLKVKSVRNVIWDLTTTSEPPYIILPDLRFRDYDLLPDFLLEEHLLGVTQEYLTLNGNWLGEALEWHASRTGQELVMNTSTAFGMLFDLTIPPIYDPKTGVKLNDGAELVQQLMNIRLDLNLSRNGLLTEVHSAFSWEDKDGTQQDTKIPAFTLYTPPPNKNAILGHIERELQANINKLFPEQGRHAFDFFIGEKEVDGKKQPAIILSQSKTPSGLISSSLPKLFTADATIVSDTPVFTLKQSGDKVTLNINTQNQSPSDITAAYKDLWEKVTAKNPASGAVYLLRRRLAELLPMPYDQVLQYYYGWKDNYLDLVPGMRLKVDFQNYQFAQASNPLASKGFVGSGSSYVMMHSYLHQDENGPQHLLGFDAFFSRLATKDNVSLFAEGAGGFFDIHQPDNRKAYYRLFYPQQSGIGDGPERVATVIGTTTLAALQSATDKMLEDGSITTTDDQLSFYFRGNASITPEIQVFVGDQPVFVPLGTTIRQLIERHAAIPAAQLSGQDLTKFLGYSRPLRLIHDGINSEPLYVFINLESYQLYENGMDAFDLPLIIGDRFYF